MTQLNKIHYIIIDDNESKTLHRGDIYAPISVGNNASGYLGFTIQKFDCGETLNSNYHFSFSDEKPSEDKYDQICEGCFGIEQ